jgi:hypothetical protein
MEDKRLTDFTGLTPLMAWNQSGIYSTMRRKVDPRMNWKKPPKETERLRRILEGTVA